MDDCDLSKLCSKFFFKAKGLSKQHTAGLKIHNISWPKKLNWTLPSKFAKKKKNFKKTDLGMINANHQSDFSF